jgi:hypothetical protein
MEESEECMSGLDDEAKADDLYEDSESSSDVSVAMPNVLVTALDAVERKLMRGFGLYRNTVSEAKETSLLWTDVTVSETKREDQLTLYESKGQSKEDRLLALRREALWTIEESQTTGMNDCGAWTEIKMTQASEELIEVQTKNNFSTSTGSGTVKATQENNSKPILQGLNRKRTHASQLLWML